LKSFNKHITNALQAILVVDCEKQILNYNNYAMYIVYKFFNKDLKSVKSISEIIDNKEILDETINHCKEGKPQKHFEYKIKTDEEDISFRITFISTEDLKSFIVLINEEDKSETQKLLSIISHDLISPITSIMGFSELLFQDLESRKISNLISDHIFSKDEFEALNRIIKRTKLINTSTKEAYSLLENLLEWSRSKSNVINPNIEVLNITNIISSQVLFSKNQADFKNITIEYDGKEDINVYADKNMLKTVLRNFISNAIKFTPRGGVIEITTSDIIKDGKEKYLRIDVTDTGVGIPDKTLSNLFMQGQNITTKGTESEKGTGLGLKLCKEFAEKMNGNISIRSKRGKGTIASLSLPCA
jgi:signal transduction histidine kinase